MVGVVGSSPIAPTRYKPKQVIDLLGLFGFWRCPKSARWDEDGGLCVGCVVGPAPADAQLPQTRFPVVLALAALVVPMTAQQRLYCDELGLLAQLVDPPISLIQTVFGDVIPEPQPVAASDALQRELLGPQSTPCVAFAFCLLGAPLLTGPGMGPDAYTRPVPAKGWCSTSKIRPIPRLSQMPTPDHG